MREWRRHRLAMRSATAARSARNVRRSVTRRAVPHARGLGQPIYPRIKRIDRHSHSSARLWRPALAEVEADKLTVRGKPPRLETDVMKTSKRVIGYYFLMQSIWNPCAK
jgi:hypothetical protein